MALKNYYSKSKYVRFIGCNKRLWLEKYKPEFMEEHNNEEVFINGNLIGDLAMGLFGPYYLAETADNNLKVQVTNTKDALERGEEVVCEAAFFFENNYCAVDILKKDPDGGYSIYEVPLQ